MSLLIQYLIKLSLSLAVVWLFYHFMLRKLTFYNSNRWYLLAYTILSFFIPFINIAGDNSSSKNEIIQFIPSVHQYTIALEEATHCPTPIWSTNYDKWDFTAFGLMIVASLLLLRFLIRYLSFLRIKNNSRLISTDGVNIYQVDKHIIPFSFGNSVFINTNLHSQEELQEIVRHEFVHVRQKHTIDILWAELLCIINWYNPFAWLLKRSIRQNLEFIADNKVVENGINKKQYQYLLLKVIGNNQYSIATQFNFSSLKKRIAMMNKTKTAKRQVGRFLLLLPLLAVILLSFRKTFTSQPGVSTANPPILTDTIPDVTITNSKGYYIDIKDDNGNCTVVVKDKNKNEVKRVLLTEWNANESRYENLYGEIPHPFLQDIETSIRITNPDVRSVSVKNNIATVTLNNGKKEVYTLSLSPEKKAFENKYCLPNDALIPTTSLQKITVEGEVESLAVIREEPIKEARPANTVEGEVVAEAITATGVKTTVNAGTTITSTNPELAEVTVIGKKSIGPGKTITSVATTKSDLEEITVIGKPAKAITGNIVQEPIGVVQEKRILHLGGLTIMDEGQYILLDGKEVARDAYEKLKGPFRITFVDGKDAERKYGSKGKNGAILLDTIQ